MKSCVFVVLLALLVLLVGGCVNDKVDPAPTPSKTEKLEVEEMVYPDMKILQVYRDTAPPSPPPSTVDVWEVLNGQPVVMTMVIEHPSHWVETLEVVFVKNSPVHWEMTHSCEGGYGPEPNSFTVEASVPEDSPTSEPFTLTVSSPTAFTLTVSGVQGTEMREDDILGVVAF